MVYKETGGTLNISWTLKSTSNLEYIFIVYMDNVKLASGNQNDFTATKQGVALFSGNIYTSANEMVFKIMAKFPEIYFSRTHHHNFMLSQLVISGCKKNITAKTLIQFDETERKDERKDFSPTLFVIMTVGILLVTILFVSWILQEKILIYFGLDRKTKEDIPLKNRIVPNFEKLFPNFKRPGENIKPKTAAVEVNKNRTLSDSLNVSLEITNNQKKGKSEVEKEDMKDKNKHAQTDSTNVELEITNNQKEEKSEVEKKEMEDIDKHAQTDSTNGELEITNNQKDGKHKVDAKEKEESRAT
ncbi:uncharacterized protein LOC130635455 [Hydractinia symbiolongicarpus]|uniref:uncharacterized protein LOC130635455 n=1 Tax=Hydractinia symbiolongicarpus TaxID=13093 RepID=UPI00254C86AD|nr:uncharacterized protein LOC130635455 [Hydractinia symbiolongicarpus]